MTDNTETFIDGKLREFNARYGTNYTTKSTRATPSQHPLNDAELVGALDDLEIMFNQLETIHDCTGYISTPDFVGIDANLDNVRAAIRGVKEALKPHLGGGWLPIESAPKDGSQILVKHSHSSDEYHLGEGRLTIYGAWCEHLGFETNEGVYIACYGGGYTDGWDDGGSTMPDWWFKHDSDFEQPLAPTLWKPLGDLPQPLSEVA